MLRKDAVLSCPQFSMELPAGWVDHKLVMSTTQLPTRPQQSEVLECCDSVAALILLWGEELGLVVVVTPAGRVTVVVVITGYSPESWPSMTT